MHVSTIAVQRLLLHVSSPFFPFVSIFPHASIIAGPAFASSNFLLFSTPAFCLQTAIFLTLQPCIFLSGIIDNGTIRSDSNFYPEKLLFPSSDPSPLLLHPNQQPHLRLIPTETPRIEAQNQYCTNYKKRTPNPQSYQGGVWRIRVELRLSL